MKSLYIVYDVNNKANTKQIFLKLQLAIDYYKKMLKKYPEKSWRFEHKEIF